MSFPVFPTLSQDPVSDEYEVEFEDPSIKTDLEGGYVSSRPRHTRKPRQTWMIKFVLLNQADKVTLQNFYNSVMGGSAIFTWVNPEDKVTYYARFKEPLKFGYKQMGQTKQFNCAITLEEA